MVDLSIISSNVLAMVVESSVTGATFAIVVSVMDRTMVRNLLAMVGSMLDGKGSATDVELVNTSEESCHGAAAGRVQQNLGCFGKLALTTRYILPNTRQVHSIENRELPIEAVRSGTRIRRV